MRVLKILHQQCCRWATQAMIIACWPASLLGQDAGQFPARHFDEVAFLYTHNAYNSSGKHRFPNQSLSIAQQLVLGVRGLMLDVYAHHPHRAKGAKVMVYHANRLLGHRPLQEDLLTIQKFLDQHPTEILSIIFESHVAADLLAQEIQYAGLLPYVYTPPSQDHSAWPTLQEMIDRNQRLVVFSEKDRDNPYPWLLHVWDFATENRYSNHARADFESAYHRGDSANALYLLNHFITHRKFGFGKPDSALRANSFGNVMDHAIGAWAHTKHFPNFIAVDFVELGEAKRAVDTLNGMYRQCMMDDDTILLKDFSMHKMQDIFLQFSKETQGPMTIVVREILTGQVVHRITRQECCLHGVMLPHSAPLPEADYRIELWMGNHFERWLLHWQPTSQYMRYEFEMQ